MSKELLEQAEALTADIEEMSTRLTAEYGKFCDTVRTNCLERSQGARFANWQTTFDLPDVGTPVDWAPSDDTQDIGFTRDGDDRYWMPKAYLEDPEAWLQGALAAHGQAVADQAATVAQQRAAKKAELRRQLAAMEAEE